MGNLILTIKIKNKREDILIGEVGALLHDIGKCHPNFVKYQSKDNKNELPDHAKGIDNFLNVQLIDLFKKIKVKFGPEETAIYDFIRYHHDRDRKGTILKYLKKCDQLDSADDKGIVRKKQSINNTIISSPFGFSKEKIDLQCLEKRFEDLQINLIELFKNYVSDKFDLICFRKSLINNIRTPYSHALGETRIPSNDVTLWDHSNSTASLFKSVLCAIVLSEKNPDDEKFEKLQWRIFGFCWDGIGFINKGKKIADILERNNIIEEIKKKLKENFEVDIPIGNAIYEDNNGIYFTFPELKEDGIKKLAEECSEIGLKIISTESNDEIWPFFILSRPSRSLTTLAEILKFASKKRKIPKMTPILFIDETEDIILDNLKLTLPNEKEDICPVCKFRTKPLENDRCNICKERIEGRLYYWYSNREDTIWIDEVADENNRIALISLDFNLDKWFDGTMIGTIYSQSFEDWKNGKKWDEIKNSQILVEANRDSVYQILDKVLKLKDSDKENAAKLLDTFFEEDVGLKKDNSLNNHLSNIKERIKAYNLTPQNLATYLFTQNPSPARIYRIWREVEEFFDLAITEIKSQLFTYKWERINFKIDISNFKQEKPEKNTPYIIKIKELEPENLLIFHSINEEFYTIESLEKFKYKEYKDRSGVNAVQEVLTTNGFYWVSKEEEPNKNLLQNGQIIKVDKNEIKVEYYYPFIKITKSPLITRFIVPAFSSIKILELVSKLYNQKFEKVIGKLPINVGLLVVKRKFPLYVLLDAVERLFKTKKFENPVMMDVWWDIDNIRDDNYYGFYPIKELKENKKYTLDDLVPLYNGKLYALFPGYFDFDLLLDTSDRYNITYREKRRFNNYYNIYTNRPYYFYQFSLMIKLWEILKNNLSNSQINFIEETLRNKMREWRDVNDESKNNVIKKFFEAILKDAFADKWVKLEKNEQDFVLSSFCNNFMIDTINLFKHIIKEKGG